MNDKTIIEVRDVRNDDIVFGVNGSDVTYNLTDLMSMSDATISNDMMELASKFARLAVLYASAKNYMIACKRVADVVYAQLDDNLRANHKANKIKYTEALLKNEITAHESYIEAIIELENAQYAVEVLRQLIDSLKMKSDMLISVGAQLRSEMGMTGMHINDEMVNKINALKARVRKKI